MANILIQEADDTASRTLATGSGTDIDPKIPGLHIIDPASGLIMGLEQTDWGKNVLPIHDEHVHQFEFNTHMAKPTDTPFTATLTAQAAVNTYQLTLSTVTGLAVGNKLQLRTSDGTQREFDYIRVQAINGLIVDIDRRLDKTYAIGSVVERFTLDLNVNGSLATPVSFKYYPRYGKVQHLENLIVYIRSALQPYDSYFGGIDGLTNGIHIRKYNGATSEYQGFDVVRVNQRFVQSGWNVSYGDRSSPADAYSTLAKINLFKFSSSMRRLVQSDGDYFEVLVQDPLSTLDGFEFKIAGHEEV